MIMVYPESNYYRFSLVNISLKVKRENQQWAFDFEPHSRHIYQFSRAQDIDLD